MFQTGQGLEYRIRLLNTVYLNAELVHFLFFTKIIPYSPHKCLQIFKHELLHSFNNREKIICMISYCIIACCKHSLTCRGQSVLGL